MATYGSYKKISNVQLPDNAITGDMLKSGVGNKYCSFYVYSARGMLCKECSNAGGCVCQACGRCCLWTVPDRVSTVTFEIWSGGGGGPGNTCCDCHFHSMGGAGGGYAQKTIETAPGCQYTVCAGGSWPCARSYTCTASMGCRSYVTGFNLSNFCVMGGCGGHGCIEGDNWGRRERTNCANCGICGVYGADFGMLGTVGNAVGNNMCYCHGRTSFPGQPPMIGRTMITTAHDCTFCSCGCYVNWPAGGGMSAEVNRCGEDAGVCCAAGSGQGGSGIVRITFS